MIGLTTLTSRLVMRLFASCSRMRSLLAAKPTAMNTAIMTACLAMT